VLGADQGAQGQMQLLGRAVLAGPTAARPSWPSSSDILGRLSLLLPQFRIVVILSGTYAVQNFVPILLLTNGGPGTATLVPGLDMYQFAFSNDQYGHGMAIGTLLFVVMLVFTLVAMRLLRSRTA